MPSTYAHYKFGEEVLKLLPAPLAEIVRAERAAYSVALHGPDVLSYYKALRSNAVNSIGFATHERPAREFFVPARTNLAAFAEQDAAKAYLFGFVCHFALDSACHGYIENKIARSDVRHTVIESEFDRSLLLADGKDPLSARLTDHILPTARNAALVAAAFGIDADSALCALRSMLSCNEFLRAPGHIKRTLVRAVLFFSGNYREMHGAMIARKPVAACADSTLRLKKLFDAAVPRAAALILALNEWLEGRAELPAEFGKTFGAGEGWQDIPVLTAEEEAKYVLPACGTEILTEETKS